MEIEVVQAWESDKVKMRFLLVLRSNGKEGHGLRHGEGRQFNEAADDIAIQTFVLSDQQLGKKVQQWCTYQVCWTVRNCRENTLPFTDDDRW